MQEPATNDDGRWFGRLLAWWRAEQAGEPHGSDYLAGSAAFAADVRAAVEEIIRLQELKVLDHDQVDASDKLLDFMNARDRAQQEAEKLRGWLEYIARVVPDDSEFAQAALDGKPLPEELI